jgi:DNA-binding MarR family transcriptional regulator
LPTLTIADRVIEKTPGITRMIDRLEAKGLVSREIRPHDRRCVYCRITKKGLKLLSLLDAPVQDFNDRAFHSLTDRELEPLMTLLLKIRQSHEEDE